jgi:1-acyl-sn-glycerol-3-phosphate acyltransferase
MTTLIINTLVMAPILISFTLLRILLPLPGWRRWCTNGAIASAELWISVNCGFIKLTQNMQWEIQGTEHLTKDNWYLVTSNHQSYTDIVILQCLFNRKIPMLKFFLKQQLIWVPVIGLCWWALDFPFMKRYSKEHLEKHPEDRGKDYESARRACQKFKYTPVTVFNFLEGTRFTPEKQQRQQSPYKFLLKPKTGGIAYVIGAMGDSMHSMLDVSIAYPGNPQVSLWSFMSGQVPLVRVHVQQREIPTQFLNKNYIEDEAFRSEIQQWVTQLWAEKDALLEQLRKAPDVGSDLQT